MLISGRKYKMKLKFGYNKGYTPPPQGIGMHKGVWPNEVYVKCQFLWSYSNFQRILDVFGKGV